MTVQAGSQTYFMTGCASGIAQYIADRLIERGARVYATDVNLEAMQHHAQSKSWPPDRVKLDRLDVRKLDEWEQVFQRAVDAFSTIEVCMNIAGVMLSGWCYEQPPKEIDLQIDVNLKGVIWGTRTAAKHMMKNRRGHIVNIASLAGIAPIPGLSAYVASKYGVRGYTRAIASELFEHGIYVTVVCPDAVMTPLIEQSSRHEAGILVFSGGRLLTLEEAGQIIIHRAVERREIEVAFPTSRAWLSHLASTAPWLGKIILPRLIRKGKAHQEEHVRARQHPGDAAKQS